MCDGLPARAEGLRQRIKREKRRKSHEQIRKFSKILQIVQGKLKESRNVKRPEMVMRKGKWSRW